MIPRIVAATFALALTVTPALAHRLDEYAQVAAISVTNKTVTIDLRLTPGQLVAEEVLALIDTDMDGRVSPEEEDAYVAAVVNDLSVTVDGLVQGPVVSSYAYPDEPSIRAGVGIISITLEVAVKGAGDHKLSLVNRHMPGTAVYLVNALVPIDSQIVIGEQRRSHDQAAYELEWTMVDGLDV